MTLAENDKSLPVNNYFTNLTKNVKYALECSECLVFKPFLIPIIQNINAETHLVLVDTYWPQELPVEHTVVTIINKKYTRMQILYLYMQWKPHSCIL